MRSRISVLALPLVVAAACGRPRTVDVLTMAPVCDSVAPPALAGALPPHVPSSAPASETPGRGVVVGWVAQEPDGPALPGVSVAVASLAPGPDSGYYARGAQTDAAGAFVFNLSPGAYQLQFRSIRHRPAVLPVRVRAGATDTVTVRLSYYACGGY